jgi:hypothetical protein
MALAVNRRLDVRIWRGKPRIFTVNALNRSTSLDRYASRSPRERQIGNLGERARRSSQCCSLIEEVRRADFRAEYVLSFENTPRNGLERAQLSAGRSRNQREQARN